MRAIVIALVIALGAVTQAIVEVIPGATALDQGAEVSRIRHLNVADRREGGQYPAMVVA